MWRTWLIRATLLFIILFILSLPFGYQVLPNVGHWLAPFFEKLVRASGLAQVFGISQSPYSRIISDSSAFYIHSFILLQISMALSFIWTRWKPAELKGIRYSLETVAAHFLSLQLFIYGFNKVFKYQFYFPEPNLLFTPMGNLSKDILFWSTMGTSYSYSIFSGLIEVLPAVLLLFRKTRVLGALIALAVMTNVVMINIGFDISVKVFSMFLWLLCLVVLIPYLPVIIQFFGGAPSQIEPIERPILNQHTKVLAYAIGKPLVVGIILFEALLPYFETGVFNGDRAPKHQLVGSYTVETLAPNSKDSLDFTMKRFHIHSKGYFIIESEDGTMTSFDLSYEAKDRLTLSNATSVFPVTYGYQWNEDEKSLKLTSHWHIIDAKKIDISQMPIYDTESHWTIDHY